MHIAVVNSIAERLPSIARGRGASRQRGADASSGALPDPHVEVEVRLGDLLDQSAMVYPVESVTVERAWYCTMPERAVLVRIV